MIARGGRGLVALSAAAAAVTFPFQVIAFGALAGLTGFLLFVFRDPDRRPGKGVVAPADGTVREVDREKGLVSIYLALRNVHVTRAPIDGVVDRAVRHLGKHAPAFSKKTPHNEKVEIGLKTDIGDVSIIHMSGAIARRIVPYVTAGQRLGKAQRLGLIRFGSRVDLYLPPKAVEITVRKGQKLHAGVSCIAEVRDGPSE